MKKLFVMVAVCMMALSLTAGAQTINLNLKNVSVSDAVAALNRAENYSVIVKSSGIDMGKKVNVSADNATIQDVLNQIFAGQDVSYLIDGRSISVIRKEALSSHSASAPSRTIKGKVLDSDGEPLIGATLFVKNTQQGFITNMDGSYELTGISFPANVVVSFIGLKDVEVVLNGNEPSPYNIVMKDTADALKEVVVVGYGTQKRVNVTGAVGVIDGKELAQRPVTSAAQALQGADPGLLLSMGNGSVEGEQFSVSIRGNVSLNSGEPLILIDGIEGSLSQVNPNDIESVSVLKDASSCAIYGAKASAGVVLINTKNGSAGTTRVSYSGRFSLSENTTSTDFITTGYDFMMFENEFYVPYKGYNAWTYTDDQIKMMYDRRNDKVENPSRPWVVNDETGKYTYLYLGNFDWYGYMFKRTRPETEHNITMTGGNDRINYYASGRYLYREGFFNQGTSDFLNSYSFRAKVDAKVTNWLRYSNNISFERSKYDYGGFWEQDGSEGFMSAGIIYNAALNISPTYVPFNPDGTINIQPGYMADATSPLASGRGGVWMDGRNSNCRTNNWLTMTNRLTFDIVDGLKFIADYTYRSRNKLGTYRCLPTINSYDNANKRMYSGNGQTGGIFTNGSVYDFYREERLVFDNNVINAYFQYNNTFGKDHNFAATLGGNFDDYHQSSLINQQKGSLSEALSYINMSQGTIEKAEEANTAYRTLGFFGRVNYDFKGKYLLELSGRFDGSSRFPLGQRWGFFPSASIGWRMSEEPFWAPLKGWWNKSKIRASYGSLGNQQVSNYYYFDTISTTSNNSYTFNGVDKFSFAKASDPVSSSLTWETVITYNLGFDFGFFRDRLNLSADFYIRDTKNMLTTSSTLPDVYGAAAPKENAADLRTKGYEITASWRDQVSLAGKPFTYGIAASLGDYKSTITRYENPNKNLGDYYEGMTLGEIWGYHSTGLFASDEEAAKYQAQINSTAVNKAELAGKAPYNKLMAGDVRFEDLNGDKVISNGNNTANESGDMRVIGNKLPRYLYSMRGDFQWNGFDFNIFFQGVGKVDWTPDVNCVYFWGPYANQRVSFISKNLPAQCWSDDNTNAYFPRRRTKIAAANSALGVNSDRYLQNAAYLRLKNLSIGYTIPINPKIINKLRVYFSGENLCYWSPLKKYCDTVDPEVATTTSIGDCLYPYAKTFSFGVDITF